MLINAAWGLGEAIVGGLVTPDMYGVDKHSGALLAREIADKAVMTVRTVDGTQEVLVPAEKRHAPTLSLGQARLLAELGARIKAMYGQPMDIEWVLHEGRIWIVQARPITALPTQKHAL
ncbi:MAG: hypothetical protein H0X37_09105 [Herpetosiphonaceae bacterium]|nr:hypothetical protein [Herpetosiphonaceae bacterium]